MPGYTGNQERKFPKLARITFIDFLPTRLHGVSPVHQYVHNVMQIDITQNTEPYVRLAEIAERLGVKYETVLDWTKRDDLPVLRLPGALRVRPSEVAKWLEQFQKEAK